MKILRVISSMDPQNGGPCQGIRNAIPELLKQGVENEVVCMDPPDAQFLGKDSFKVTAIGPSKTSWCYSKKLLPWLIENIGRFDVIIVHGLWQYHGYAVYKAISQLKKMKTIKVPRYYVMPHGMLDPYFQIAEGRKLKAIRNRLYWRLIESRVINNADGVLFTCEAELLLAHNTFAPYHPKKELNVGYGIEAPPPKSSEMEDAFLKVCPESENKPFILFLSRIHPKKGIDLLVKAYTEILQSGMELPILLVAGPGMETEYGQHLKQMVDKNNLLKNKIFFTGMLIGNEKWGAFYGCEAFILPSHQENFGIAVVEALACGKPVLISDQVNIWREIKAKGAGIVKHDTFDGVVGLLTEWLSIENIRRIEMSQHADRTYQTNFDIYSSALLFKNSVC